MPHPDASPDRPETAGEPGRIQHVLRLFRDQLGDVVFPDVSAAVLEAQVADLAVRRTAVSSAHARLREAEAELDAARHSLSLLVDRALAYARVYAAGRPELESALEALEPGRAPRAKSKSPTVPVKARTSTSRAPATTTTEGTPVAPVQATLPSELAPARLAPL